MSSLLVAGHSRRLSYRLSAMERLMQVQIHCYHFNIGHYGSRVDIDGDVIRTGHLSLAFIESCNYLSESCKDFIAGLLVPKVVLTLHISASK